MRLRQDWGNRPWADGHEPTEVCVPHRLVPLLVSAALALCVTGVVAAAAAKTPKVARGHTLAINVTTTSLAVCIAIVEYADRLDQTGSVKKARDGQLSWAVRIPRTATLGRGSWTVRCGLRIEGRGAFIVVTR